MTVPCLHRNILAALTVATLLALPLCGCSSDGPVIDSRTGQPMMAGPWENRNVSLTTYRVNVFGKYRLTHAGLQGVNIQRCYAGAPQDDVQLIIHEQQVHRTPPGMDQRKMPWKEIEKYPLVGNGVFEPALSYYSQKWGEQRTSSLGFFIDGIREHNTITLHDKTKTVSNWVSFNDLCGDRIAGGTFRIGIRNSARWSIDEHVADMKDSVSHPNRQYQDNHFIDEPQRIRRGANEWTYLNAIMPTPVGDGQEEWMLPIGDSGYYFYLGFGYRSPQRAANDPDYLRAHQLFEGILDSVKVEKL